VKKLEVVFGVLRVPIDALVVAASLFLSYQLRVLRIDLIPRMQLLDVASTLPTMPEYVRTFILPGAVLFVIIAAVLRLYAMRATLSAWTEVGRVIGTTIIWLGLVIAWYFLVRKQLFYSRILLLHSAFFIAFFAVLARSALILIQRFLLRMGYGVRTIITLGSGHAPAIALTILQGDVRYRYLGHLPDVGSLRRMERDMQIDLVLQTDPRPESNETLALIDHCRSRHIGYGFLPPVLADVPHQLRVEHLGLLPLVRFQPTPLDGWGRVMKRTFDLIAGTLILILFLPILTLLGLLILLLDGWPVFYVSRRVGQHGRGQIPVLKFRTMVCDADRQKAKLTSQNERADGPLFKMRHDPRVTRLGRQLRRWSLDELPQLLNVIVGHLSLVGPRPHLPDEVARYSPVQRRVFAVKPGVTGLAQVSGRSDLKFEEEVRLDMQYVEEWSFRLDLWILWRTFFALYYRGEE
jgi:exopolysaccharide biosynthesis polyprenyl glycosylphosphotransferase